MKKYIAEYDKALLKKNEKEIHKDLNISKEFDEKMMKICNEMKWKEKSVKGYLKVRKIAAAIVIMFLIITGAGVATNAATGGKVVDLLMAMFGAEIVTDENRGLIGKEVVGGEVIISNEAESGTVATENTQEIQQLLADSSIVVAIDEEMLLPHSIEDIKVNEGNVPEVIMTNGAAVVLYQNDFEGWKCSEGETIIFEFEKYESEVVEEQAMAIGYVKDGVMHEFEEVFRECEGSYELEIEQDGEYYIYVVSATSDYLTLKKGEISIKK